MTRLRETAQDRDSALPGIRRVSGGSDLDEIFRLRFRRYFLDYGKRYPGTNETNGTLVDAEDHLSVHLADCSGGRITAALRLTFLGDVPPDSYLAPLTQAMAATHGPDTIICSRLVMAEKLSSLRSMIGLFRCAYAIGLESGSSHSALSTREELGPHFARFGYRQTGIQFEHPVSGPQQIMVLDLHDIAFLSQIGSPLARIYWAHSRAGEVTP